MSLGENATPPLIASLIPLWTPFMDRGTTFPHRLCVKNREISCDRSMNLAARRAVTPTGWRHSPDLGSINGPEEASR